MTNPSPSDPNWVRRTIESWFNEASPAIQAAQTPTELEAVRVKYFARHSEWRVNILKYFGALSREHKRDLGGYLNGVLEDLEAAHDNKKRAFDAAGARDVQFRDRSLPARRVWRGAKHPVTLVVEEIDAIFRELGFTIAQGPDAETEWYNFGALNFPANHPALDAHDTLYLEGEGLLRTHTSPVQIRTLQKYPPPIRVLIPGNAYRRDFFDASHAPVFMQIEGLCVDEGISFVDLKSTLNVFAERFFGAAKTRFRPSFFPFTEPSAEMDVLCGICSGAGCAACKGTGWIEILGSGMVHPKVLEASGIDSERYTGWAFGMGPARMAISRYKIPDIRILYDSDVRFLEQIAGSSMNGTEPAVPSGAKE
jgi:phenylalanyl-tRNA synthetase alpha chain